MYNLSYGSALTLVAWARYIQYDTVQYISGVYLH